MVERPPCKRNVAGSNPARSTNSPAQGHKDAPSGGGIFVVVEDWTVAQINRALIRYAGFRVYGCRDHPMNRLLDKRALQQRRTRHILAWVWQQNRQAVGRNVSAPFSESEGFGKPSRL